MSSTPMALNVSGGGFAAATCVPSVLYNHHGEWGSKWGDNDAASASCLPLVWNALLV